MVTKNKKPTNANTSYTGLKYRTVTTFLFRTHQETHQSHQTLTEKSPTFPILNQKFFRQKILTIYSWKLQIKEYVSIADKANLWFNTPIKAFANHANAWFKPFHRKEKAYG